MASAMYNPGLDSFAKAEISLLTATIRAFMVDSADYTFSAAHQFLSSVAVAGRVAFGDLANKTVTNGGVFDADDLLLTNVTGDPTEVVVLCAWTGLDTTSRLISFHDPVIVTPVGMNVLLQWNASGIFKL